MISSDAKFQRRLEVLSDQALPGFDRSHVGDWVMRAAIGATGRANSAWPSGDPGIELSAAVDLVEGWYGEHGLRPGFQLFGNQVPGVQEVLLNRSYIKAPGALVMWAPLDKIQIDAGSPVDSIVKLTPEIDPGLAQLIEDPDRVREISMPLPPSRFAAAVDSTGQLLGGGKSVLIDDSVGVFTMLTAKKARRQGIARDVLRHLLEDGASHGATWAWLQVAPDNNPAISLYRAVGFEAAHSYVYMFGPSS